MFLLFSIIACSDKGDADEVQLPPEDTYVAEDTAEPYFDAETGLFDTGYDEVPPYQLHIAHTGMWTLSPVAGPYTSLQGELNLSEIIDNNDTFPYCDFRMGITGYASEAMCNTCDFGFEVNFYLLDPEEPEEGEEVIEPPEEIPIAESLGDCFSPDLPHHQEVRQMAYSIEEETLYFNYYDTGIWLPWYPAVFIHDSLEVNYTQTLAFYGVGEDD
ncbi:MAG: hypothetical protein VX278_15045 [Myxococcota bacterium]|nr:hypothetical protein [Myxococcota bacterium]